MTEHGRHDLALLADHFQFHLQDDDRTAGADGDAWTPEAMTARVAVGDRFLAVGTATNLDVPVTLLLGDGPPPPRHDASHVVEADLVVTTGRLVVLGCTEDFDRAARVPVEPGRYRVRVSWRFLVPGDHGFGDQYDHVVDLWPSDGPSARLVLLQGPEIWAG